MHPVCMLPPPDGVREMMKSIREADEAIFYLAGEELRASRRHAPGQFCERYRDLRREARAIAKHRDEMWMLIYSIVPPAYIVDSNRINPELRL